MWKLRNILHSIIRSVSILLMCFSNGCWYYDNKHGQLKEKMFIYSLKYFSQDSSRLISNKIQVRGILMHLPVHVSIVLKEIKIILKVLCFNVR